MNDFPQQLRLRTPVLVRAMNAMVRALGGGSMKLRVPSAAVIGVERELGITGPALDEIDVGPVVVRTSTTKSGRAQMQAIVSAGSLGPLLAARGDANAYVFLQSAESVMYEERVFHVTEIRAESFGGVEYMYRMTAVE